MSETIFHKIIKKEIPADIVYEDDEIIAFKDIEPASPTHILFVPKQTLPSLAKANESHEAILGKMLIRISKYAEENGISEDGYRVVINTGEGGGQTVFQLHMHLLSGRELRWPPG